MMSYSTLFHALKPGRAVLAAATVLCALNASAVEYHVSALSGSNGNPGTEANPFLTIQHAAGIMIPGDICIIHEGDYYEEVSVTSDDVTFKAAPGEAVTVSAFQRVTGWTVHSGAIYKADLGWNDIGDQNQVLFNGQMMNLARWPNKTNFDPFDLEAAVAWGNDTSISHAGIPNWNWGNGGVVWFLGKSRWTSWRQPATGAVAGTVYFNTLPTSWDYGGQHNPANGGEVILMNILEALDSDGEWYIDRSANRIYFQAPGGVDPDTGTVEVRRRSRVFNLTGRTGVTVSGLTIEGGMVDLSGAIGCVIKNNRIYYGNHTISSTGSFRIYDASIKMNNSTTDCRIWRNDIQWGAANGIIVDGTGNRVDNNHIGNFNYIGSYGTGVWFIGDGSHLTRNQIFNAGRDTINGGDNGGNIGYNDVHHSNMINDDCGGIYTCCNTSYNYTRIHHNWFHDIYSRDTPGLINSYKGAGVYLDNTSREVIVDHNVMWNLEWSCIQFNWAGEDLLFYNNTLWSNAGAESKSMGWWQNGYSITNIQLYNTLANNGNFVSTDEQNTTLMAFGSDPFEDYAHTNFMPNAATVPIDAGRLIPPYTDGFFGAAPDAGAYERGGTYWLAGPDWAIGEVVSDEQYRPLVGLFVSAGAGTLDIVELSAFSDYRIEIAPELGSGWTPIHDFTAPYEAEYTFVDEARTNETLFYRVVELLPTDPPISGPVQELFSLDFTAAEGFSDGVSITGIQGIQAQPDWVAGNVNGMGYASGSTASWQRSKKGTSFTLAVGQSVVIETTLRLQDADGTWSDADNFQIGFAEAGLHSGQSIPSIYSAIHTFTDGSYWFGGTSAANRINVSTADAGDWIKFTQMITRESVSGEFSTTVSAYNVTDDVDLGSAASSWMQSTADGSWGGSMNASFRINGNSKLTALHIDEWTVSTTTP